MGIELWQRAPGLFKESVGIQFLNNFCNLGIHHTENRHFRISLTSLEKNNDVLNQIILEMIFTKDAFENVFSFMKG